MLSSSGFIGYVKQKENRQFHVYFENINTHEKKTDVLEKKKESGEKIGNTTLNVGTWIIKVIISNKKYSFNNFLSVNSMSNIATIARFQMKTILQNLTGNEMRVLKRITYQLKLQLPG